MRKSTAFTLIELLIVIAIIAILAALIFPVFAAARGKARQTTCASNFKQQAMSIQMYCQDYNDFMPLTYYSPDGSWNSPPSKHLWQFIKPYLKNIQVYKCPSDPASDKERETLYVPPPDTPDQIEYNFGIKNNFGFNYQYLSPTGTQDGVHYISIPTYIADISNPANTVLAVDSTFGNDEHGNPVAGGFTAVEPPCRKDSDGKDSFPSAAQSFSYLTSWGGWHPAHLLWGNRYGFARPWHGNHATVAFCDGHVKSLTMNALAAGCDVQEEWGGNIIDSDKYLWDLQ